MRYRVFPLLLIAVGAVMLAVKLDYVAAETVRHLVHTWWPLALIAAGLLLLLRPGYGCRRCGPTTPGESKKS